MRYLVSTDYEAIAVYIIILVSIAFYWRKKASKGLQHYFLGANRLPWWALGISGMSSFTDMAGTMVIVSFLFMLGPRGLYVAFRGGAVLVLAFMLAWSGKWHRRSSCMTGAEWMEFRFGRTRGGQMARVLSACAKVVTTVGMLIYLMKALGFFMSMFVPLSPAQCVLIMVSLATLYTAVSGFYGVVYTDLVQSAIVVSATVVIAVLALSESGVVGNFPSLAAAVTGNAQWTSSSLVWQMHMPKGYEAYQDLSMLAVFYLLRNMLFGISSAGADPRYFAARNERECGTMTFLWTSLMTFRWPMMIGFAMLGILMVHRIFPDQNVVAHAVSYIKANFHNVSRESWDGLISSMMNTPSHYSPEFLQGLRGILHGNWQSKLSLLSYNGTINPEKIVPAVILMEIPAGIRGLLVITFVAAAFSSFNSTVNTTTAYFTRDIYQRFFRPAAKDRELLFASYAFICAMVLVSYTSAFRFKSITQIWGWIVMGLGGGLAIPSMLKFYWWRYNGSGFAIGTLVGILSSFVEIVFFPQLLEWQQFIAVATVSLIATIAGTLLTQPTEDGIAMNFYRTTRPFGFWGPFKSRLNPAIRRDMEREHRNDIISAPFALGWQICLFFLPMQLMVGNYRQFLITLVIFLLCLAGMYFFWYRKLPERIPTDEGATGAGAQTLVQATGRLSTYSEPPDNY